MPTLNLNSNLNEQQRSSITSLLGSGRSLNETDARNLAYATGQGNWQQYVGQSASNYNIGNLAQFTSPATSNTNPSNGSNSTLPNLGSSTMGSYFQNSVNSGLSQFEQSILNYTNQQQQANEAARTQAQSQYDQAYAGLKSALNPAETGQAMMTRLMGEYGIKEKQDQLVEFQKQLANLQNQATNANNAIGAQPINTAIIRGQQFLKNQEFASKATLIQAQGAIVEGQLNVAKDLVSSYYDAATQDRQNQISRYQTLLGLADKQLVKLDAADKDSLNMLIGTLQNAETRQQNNKDKIAELMMDPIASIAMSKTTGISLNDDYATIVQKLLPQMAQERLRQFGILHPGSTKNGSGGTSVGGLGITGKNMTADIDNIGRLFAGMGTNLTDSQYKQAVYALVDTYKFDTTMGEGSDYNTIASDLNNAIARYRTQGSATGPVATDTGNMFGPSKPATKKAPKQVAGDVTNFNPADRFGNLWKMGGDIVNWWNNPR